MELVFFWGGGAPHTNQETTLNTIIMSSSKCGLLILRPIRPEHDHWMPLASTQQEPTLSYLQLNGTLAAAEARLLCTAHDRQMPPNSKATKLATPRSLQQYGSGDKRRGTEFLTAPYRSVEVERDGRSVCVGFELQNLRGYGNCTVSKDTSDKIIT